MQEEKLIDKTLHELKYCIGGRIIYANDLNGALKKIVLKINPVDYENMLTTDDEPRSINTMNDELKALKENSSRLAEQEKNEKRRKFLDNIEKYRNEIDNLIKSAESGDSQNIRFLQIEFPFYTANNKKMIYNEHIPDERNSSNKKIKPQTFHDYFIESDVSFHTVKNIFFDKSNE